MAWRRRRGGHGGTCTKVGGDGDEEGRLRRGVRHGDGEPLTDDIEDGFVWGRGVGIVHRYLKCCSGGDMSEGTAHSHARVASSSDFYIIAGLNRFW